MLSPNFYVLPALSSQLSVFLKLCIMNTLLHSLLVCQSCRSLGNVSLGGRILCLIKSSHHGWLRMMTSSKGPLFRLASAPPTLNPPLLISLSKDSIHRYFYFYSIQYTEIFFSKSSAFRRSSSPTVQQYNCLSSYC